MGLSQCFDLAPDGPEFSTPVGTVPPSLQSGALAQADFEIRSALDRLVGSPLSDEDWRLASLGISSRVNWSSRSAEEDAPAARIASPSATAKLSRRIWPAFDENDLDSACLRSDAEFELRSRVPGGADFADEFVSSSQKALSSMIEARAFSEFMASDQVEVHRKAHFVLNLNPGAGPWLTSIPNSSDTPFAFSLLPTAPSRMAIWHEDSICPLCGQTQDRFGDHAPLPGFAAIGFAVAMLYETVVHSIARDAALSHWSRKNWGSSLPKLPVMETQIPPALPIQPTETSAAQPTFGFLAVPLGRQRPRDFSISNATCPSIWSTAGWDSQALLTSEWSLARPSYMALPLALALEVVGESWSSPLGVPLLLATS